MVIIFIFCGDGFSKDEGITDTIVYVYKLCSILNASTTSDLDTIRIDMQSSLSSLDISCVQVSSTPVSKSFDCLKSSKSDGTSFALDLIILASSLHPKYLSLFTSILCHEFMPEVLRDCTLFPVPMSHKNLSNSVKSSYSPSA